MRFKLDTEVNALYIYLRGEIPDGGVARTIEIQDGVNLDVDSEGYILGLEFIEASDFPDFLKRRDGSMDIPERIEDFKDLSVA